MKRHSLPWGRGPAVAGVLLAGAALGLAVPPAAWAQAEAPLTPKPSPEILGAFRAVTARASRSTVRVRCDGKDVALGIVAGADGWVLTKASSLHGTPVVRLPDGRERPARVVGVHEAHDIALLKVKASGLTPAEWRPSKEVPVGFWAVSPGPDGRAVAVGVVSVGTRDVPAGKRRPPPRAGGGFLGISLEPDDHEARVSQVVPGGGAAKAGLQVNDTILSVAGKAVRDPDMLLDVLDGFKPGDEVDVRVKRGEQELELRARLGKRPLDRGEFQNNLGSELSKRRSGFPTVLQHDSVIQPRDCGGPLVSLDGRVIGLNISRAGRTESFAVPTEVLLRLLPDLQAGRYLPRAPGSQTAAR
jgi:serine protease Do